jgi:hypothetical protein
MNKKYDNNNIIIASRAYFLHTWQSILAGLECFRRDVSGEWVMGLKLIWIPSSHNLKIMTPRGSILINLVSQLINHVDGLWDEELISELFWPVDVHRIL